MTFMGDLTDKERMAVLETHIPNMSKSLDAIFTRLGTSDANDLHIAGQLAVIISKQDDMKSYQERCDAERKTMASDLKDVQNYQKNQSKIAGTISGIVAVLISVGATFLPHKS